MIFPIGDDQVKKGNFPFFSYILILINIGVFFYQVSMGLYQNEYFIYAFGVVPVQILQGQNLISLLTSMFLHGGWMHLVGNMLFLWVFADNIEAKVGHYRFLLFYLTGGIVASLLHSFMNPYSEVPCVGASGAISAVMGAYMVMFPTSKIKILFFFFITFRVPAFIFLGLWAYQQYSNSIASLGTATADTAGVAWWAHLGGFGMGLITGFYFRNSSYFIEAKEDYTTLNRVEKDNFPQKKYYSDDDFV